MLIIKELMFLAHCASFSQQLNVPSPRHTRYQDATASSNDFSMNSGQDSINASSLRTRSSDAPAELFQPLCSLYLVSALCGDSTQS